MQKRFTFDQIKSFEIKAQQFINERNFLLITRPKEKKIVQRVSATICYFAVAKNSKVPFYGYIYIKKEKISTQVSLKSIINCTATLSFLSTG